MVGKKNLLIVNLIVSLILFFVLNYFAGYFLHFVFWLLDTIGQSLASLTVTAIDLLLVSLIPIWSYLFYRKIPAISIREIIIYNSVYALILSVIVLTAFILVGFFVENENPLLPENIVVLPFNFFLTIVILFGLGVATFVIARIFKSRIA